MKNECHAFAVALGALSLFAAADAVAQVMTITTDSGDTYDVPEGSSVYIAEAPVFTLETSPNGDMTFSLITSVDGVVTEGPIVFAEPPPVVEPCKNKGPIRRVDGEWRFCNGEGWIVDGPEMQWHEANYTAESAAFRAAIGDYQRYSGESIDRLKLLLVGNSWWSTRLRSYADDVLSTGTSRRFYIEFRGTSEDMQEYALQVLNRYVALIVDGYTAAEINDYVWG